MERNKKPSLLFLLLVLTLVCTINTQECPSRSDGSPLFHTDLICYNDYNNTITCTYESEHADSLCTIHGEKDSTSKYRYKSSCTLKPVDVSRPKLKKCTMVFKSYLIFLSSHVMRIDLNCDSMNQSSRFSYKPVCHIKLNPPSKPDVNFTTVSNLTTVYNITTVSWVPQVGETRISLFRSQLQWKQKDQQWSDENKKEMQCDKSCRAILPDLIQDEMYEARVRVKTAQGAVYVSTWSDWSRTASWVSPIGKVKPTPPPSDVAQGVMVTVGCVVAFALFLIFFKTNKTTWIYIVKRIRGPPLPNPEKSFLRDVNFENWLSPHFTKESFHSFLKPVDIVSVEVTSTVDAVTPRGMEAALLEKLRRESNYESTNSSFSNPSYSELSPPPPPIPLLTTGNLEPCGADTPYGPVGSQAEDKTAEQDMVEVRGKEVELLQLLSNGSNNSEPLPVISDYEKVEKPQVERFRLQSLDSGMCSGEEVSQESLEPDSINVTDCHDDGGPEGKEESEGRNGKEVDLQKFFGGSRGSFDKGSIQVCSDYERVQKLEVDNSELPSLDSCISSGGEEQVSQEESLEDVDKSTESTSLLFPPPSSSSFLLSSIPLPLDFSGTSLNSAPAPLPSHILERIALMSTTKSVKPSGDGYMPVRQDQS
ncbi:uncharacterized protein LOC109138304 isoform X1 [Larimichthys crocea]|uniref:uncharacterized protein LOC109138304 isoform X1 n=1 Tax=Larimichthys crocea TaxID=215358 RepID=UPI000F604388|nr:uncharacterized protein LOC109138304 isoform X1 [Larimichthys crocea]XP_019113704.2 uncharacterized protein LOC109138304 isoform X1 [Larimichthys crocea]XP_019113708.2 uncharacterized protein LOC109138304 isoform X1 [Larimichthys crocea]XP_019113716.2 uncharacterized protein LOC109138304 isoform X1 [Larimichthys crocea]XP_027138577.1 uncharacterized protein LOC109138304 isoform X1 [Larimichthys crocea]